MLAVLLSVCAAGAAALGGGGVKAREAAAAPRAKALTTSQRNAVRLGYVRVRVASRRPASVRVAALLRPADAGRARRISRVARVRLRRAGSRTVRLRLTRSGRRLLRTCEAVRLDVAGRSGRRRVRASERRMRSDRARCAAARHRSDGARPGTAPSRGRPPTGPPLGELNTENADRCDFLDPALCLYPWPNDHFTVSDRSTQTGRRLRLDPDSVPRNRFGKPIDPSDQNRGDGFSPGNMIITRVPGLDSKEAFQRTGAVPITDMARSFDPDQPVVVINARTKKRQPIWAEVDANPARPEDRTLIVRPARNFDEGERYIVALRRLRNAHGDELKPREEFRAYRDGIATRNEAIESRRAHFEEIFRTLQAAGIGREDLYLAWDFTVASERSLTGRALTIRDDAFARLGDAELADLEVQGAAPRFIQNPDLPDSVSGEAGNLDGFRQFAPCSAGATPACEAGEHDRTARRITGQIPVPCYLDQPGCPPGSGFQDGKPVLNPLNHTLANVICTVPRQAVDDGAESPPARPSLYGHGLLGSASEVGAGNVQTMGQEHGFAFCATDWAGMSTLDIPHVVTLLQDLSRFNTLVDRIQQGYVHFMYLGRWMIHPDGASTEPAFQVGGRSVIDTRRLFYDGNSQGGILSGGLTALTPDFEAAVHGVPGMNYSTLLRRSVDFDTYANGEFEGLSAPVGLYHNYPNELERPLILSMIQLLWDRGESNGYAHHMTSDPLPNSPRHRVLLHPAFGDHQVANVAADVEARTIGACTFRPALYEGRSPDVEPLFGIPTAGDPSCHGSGIVYFDTGPLGRIVNGEERGTAPPPTDNVPPREGRDPHSAPRSDPKGRLQKSEFLKLDGALVDVCGPLPCFADGFAGP